MPEIGLLSNNSCSPVVDILPDLKAVRCFGMSDKHLAVPIDLFPSEDLLIDVSVKY